MSLENVPVINIAQLGRPETLDALDAACREWGFFQVVAHGIDIEVLDAMHHEMHGFFGQPNADKRAISRTADNPWGFFDRELTKNIRDWKQIYDYGPAHQTVIESVIKPQWPRTAPMNSI